MGKKGLMSVGDLRRLLDGLPDELEIVVNVFDPWDDVDYCGGLEDGGTVECSHDDETPFLRLSVGRGEEEPDEGSFDCEVVP